MTGPATFLFTDIEGSTEKWEQEPERMAKAVAAHDAVLRGAVEENRGRVIKTSGDGIVAVFADPVDGIAAVVATQLALTDPAFTAGIPLAVRCGLHAGEAQRHGDDYLGMDAQPCSTRHGTCLWWPGVALAGGCGSLGRTAA